jgi:hypothetical protein
MEASFYYPIAPVVSQFEMDLVGLATKMRSAIMSARSAYARGSA